MYINIDYVDTVEYIDVQFKDYIDYIDAISVTYEVLA